MKTNEMTVLYCYDCKEVTRQHYKGQLADKSHMYICKECGSENILTEKEQEERK